MEEVNAGDTVTVASQVGEVTGTVHDIGTRGDVTEMMLTGVDAGGVVGGRVCFEITPDDTRTVAVVN